MSRKSSMKSYCDCDICTGKKSILFVSHTLTSDTFNASAQRNPAPLNLLLARYGVAYRITETGLRWL